MTNQNINLLSILSDKPTKEDFLNFKDYSDLLSDVILNSETPSTIGVFGDWGSGKTSLMMMIEDRLKSSKVKTIWFNAWKYDKEDSLWRALILSILKGLNAGRKDVDDATLKLYSAVSTEKLGQVEFDWLDVGKTLLKSAAVLTAPLLLVPGVATLFANAKFLEQVSTAFTRRKIQQSRERITSIEQFEELYKQVIRKYIGKDERIAVFIDDLDRCLPSRSLDVFEALKAFLDAEGCIYIVACDTRLIEQGIHEKYAETTGISIDEYLGKIIQFSFNIPPIRIEDTKLFLKRLNLEISSSNEIVQLISTSLQRNPRKIKRFLSDLQVKGRLAETRGLLINPPALAKMSCLANNWKVFWNKTLENPLIFKKAMDIALSSSITKETNEYSEFCKIYQVDEMFFQFLRTEPPIRDVDLNEYIFLSNATSTRANLDIQPNYFSESESNLEPNNKEKNPRKRYFHVGLDADMYPSIELPKLFVGRDSEIRQLLNNIHDATPLIALYGQRGVGKTALLRIIEISGQKSNEFIPIYLSPEFPDLDLSTVESFLARIANKITLAIKQYDGKRMSRLSADIYSIDDFKQSLVNINKSLKGKRIVLLLNLDTFSDMSHLNLLSDEEMARLDILGETLSLIVPMKQLTVLLSSRRKIETFHRKSWDKLGKMVDEEITLGAFDVQVSKMILSHLFENAVFDEDAIDFLHSQTGGNPRWMLWVVQDVMRLTGHLDEFPDGFVVTHAHIESAIKEWVSRNFQDVSKWYPESEHRILLAVAEQIETTQIPFVFGKDLRQLIQKYAPNALPEKLIEEWTDHNVIKEIARNYWLESPENVDKKFEFAAPLFYFCLLKENNYPHAHRP